MKHLASNPGFAPSIFEVHERGGSAIVGERQWATFVMFSFWNDTTDGSLAALDDSYLLLDDAMRRLVEAVYAYEGTIDRFTDDGFIAVFGVPHSHENDPERAVRAVLDMQVIADGICRHPLLSATTISYQGLVHTSPVLVGNIGANLDIAYTSSEPIVDTLRQVRRIIPANTIVVSATTQRYVRSLYDFQPCARLPTSSGADALAVSEVRGHAQVMPVDDTSTAMIGRRDELRRLQDAREQTVRQRRSRWAVVSGESGIGKTRLVAEFRRVLHRRGGTIRYGACLSHMRQRSLWAIATLVRDIVGVDSTMTLAQQSAAVESYLQHMGLLNDEIGPFVRSVLGLPQADAVLDRRMRFLDPAVLQRQTHAALRQVLCAEANTRHSAFVLEDIQWLDSASEAFVDYLLQAQSVDDAPMMFVLVARTEGEVSDAPLLARVVETVPDQVVDIRLTELPVDEQTQLLARLLPFVPETDPDVRDQIVRRSHGNPLYLEQLVQMLRDQHAVQETPQGWEATPSVADVLNDVPDTMQAVMLARVNRLAEPLRRTLQKAAICRTTFPLSLLHALDDRQDNGFDERIAELEERRFLVPDEAEQGQRYRFNPTLLREVIHDTLLQDDRSALHDEAAAQIQAHALYEGEALAYHFIHGTTPVQAVPYLVSAADHAAHRYANDLAIAQYQQARALLLQHPEMRDRYAARAGLGLGRAYKFVGAWSDAFDVLCQTLDDVRSDAAKVDMHVETLCELADVRFREGAQEAAVSFLEMARAVLEHEPERDHTNLRRLLVDRLAMIRFRQGRLDEAVMLAEIAVGSLGDDSADDPLTVASLYNTLGGVLWQQGKLHEAARYVEQSRARYEEMGYSYGVATALMNLGILLYAQGDWQQAAEHFERSNQLRRDIGYMVGRANNLLNLALLRLAMGDHASADGDVRESLMISQRLGDDYGVMRAHIGLARLAIVQQRFEDAYEHLEAAGALLQSAGEDETIQVAALRAQVFAHAGKVAAGFALIDEAISLARSTGVSEQEAECLRVLGLLHGRARDYGQAEVAFQASLEVSTTIDDPYQTALTLLERARVRLQRFREEGGERAAFSAITLDVQDATTQFARLGALFDIRQAVELQTELRSLRLLRPSAVS